MDVQITDIINKVFDRYGKEILLEGNRFCAIIADMVPKMQLELRVIGRMNQENILDEVYNILSGASSSIDKIEMLLENSGFSNIWKEIALNAFGLTGTFSQNERVVNIINDGQKNIKRKCLGKNQARNIWPSVGYQIVIPAGYNVVGRHAFDYLREKREVESVILSETIEEIQDHAFSDLVIMDYIEIPKTVRNIGEYEPFKLGKYAYVKCDSNSYAYNYCHRNLINNSVDGIPRHPINRKISSTEALETYKEMFKEDCGNILVISDAVSIEKSAFRKRDDIDILVLGQGVKYIKQNAFRDCTNLKYIYISESVRSIAAGAFANCTKLNYIEHWGSDNELQDLLADIYEEEVEKFYIAESAFDGCNEIKLVQGSEIELEKFFNKMDVTYVSHEDDGYAEKVFNAIGSKDTYNEYSDMREAIARFI